MKRGAGRAFFAKASAVALLAMADKTKAKHAVWLQRRRPGRSPYNSERARPRRSVALQVKDAGAIASVLLSWNGLILDGHVISRTWS